MPGGKSCTIRPGQRFGKLTVVEYVNYRWIVVECDCGKRKIVKDGSNLRNVPIPACSTFCRRDLLGLKVGPYTVVKDGSSQIRKTIRKGSPHPGTRHTVWIRCECGHLREVNTDRLFEKGVKGVIRSYCTHNGLIRAQASNTAP